MPGEACTAGTPIRVYARDEQHRDASALLLMTMDDIAARSTRWAQENLERAPWASIARFWSGDATEDDLYILGEFGLIIIDHGDTYQYGHVCWGLDTSNDRALRLACAGDHPAAGEVPCGPGGSRCPDCWGVDQGCICQAAPWSVPLYVKWKVPPSWVSTRCANTDNGQWSKVDLGFKSFWVASQELATLRSTPLWFIGNGRSLYLRLCVECSTGTAVLGNFVAVCSEECLGKWCADRELNDLLTLDRAQRWAASSSGRVGSGGHEIAMVGLTVRQ